MGQLSACAGPAQAVTSGVGELVLGRRVGARVLALGQGSALVVGGQPDPSQPQAPRCASGELYEARTSRWRCVAPAPWTWRDPLVVALPDGSALVAGSAMDPEQAPAGACPEGRLAALYDPSQDAWRALPEAPAWIDSRSAAMVASGSGQVLVVAASHPEPRRVSRADARRYGRWTLRLSVQEDNAQGASWASWAEPDLLWRGLTSGRPTLAWPGAGESVVRVNPDRPEAVWDAWRARWILTTPRPGQERSTRQWALGRGWLMEQLGESLWLTRHEPETWTWSEPWSGPWSGPWSEEVGVRASAGMAALWVQGVEGALLVGGGEPGSPCGAQVTWVEPRLGVALKLEPLRQGRQHHALVQVGPSQVMVVGGVCQAPEAPSCGLADLSAPGCARVVASPERIELEEEALVGRLASALVWRAKKAASAAP